MTASRLPAGDPAALDTAVAVLRSGGVVGLPTDTVYGLAVLPENVPLDALIVLKGRSEEKGVALLVNELGQVGALVEVPGPAAALAARFWPGPLTLVLPVRADARLPHLLTGGRRTLGLRVPDHAVPRVLAARLGPLAVSSANRSGSPEALDADQLLAAVPGVDLVLDGGPVAGGRSSSVVQVDSDGTVHVLREGAIPASALRAAADVAAAAGTLAPNRRHPGDAP